MKFKNLLTSIMRSDTADLQQIARYENEGYQNINFSFADTLFLFHGLGSHQYGFSSVPEDAGR